MDSVAMQHLINPPMLPNSPMPPVKVRAGSNAATAVSHQNYSFLVESSRIQNELQVHIVLYFVSYTYIKK